MSRKSRRPKRRPKQWQTSRETNSEFFCSEGSGAGHGQKKRSTPVKKHPGEEGRYAASLLLEAQPAAACPGSCGFSRRWPLLGDPRHPENIPGRKSAPRPAEAVLGDHFQLARWFPGPGHQRRFPHQPGLPPGTSSPFCQACFWSSIFEHGKGRGIGCVDVLVFGVVARYSQWVHLVDLFIYFSSQATLSFLWLRGTYGEACRRIQRDVLVTVHFIYQGNFSRTTDLQSPGRVISTTFGFIAN